MNAILLAAGLGTRLRPITNYKPKCLLEINGQSLLDRWIEECEKIECNNIFVNIHHLSTQVEKHLERYVIEKRVELFYEPELLGTAGTLRALGPKLRGQDCLVIHVDNWTDLNLDTFIAAHVAECPDDCSMSMVTFNTSNPRKCGMVGIDKNDVVIEFDEKPVNCHHDLANGAIYIFKPEVIDTISADGSLVDISTQVLPKYLGRIFAVHHRGLLVDVGTPEDLLKLHKSKLKKVK